MPSPADPALTLDQAADALGAGLDFVTHLISVGQLDHTRHDDQLRIPESALIAYAIAAGDPSMDVKSLAAPELSATTRLAAPRDFDTQEVAA